MAASSNTGIPRQPTPPVAVRANHHSIELTWGWDSGPYTGSQRPCYTLEMEDCSKGLNGGYVTVYR